MFNDFYVIMEEGWTKVTRSNDFLGSGHAREVAATCSHVAIIEDTFNFSVHEETPNEGVHNGIVHC